MLLRTRRLDIRPFTKADLSEFRRLLEIPEVPGWQMQRESAEAFLEWHIGNYAKMDIVHGIVCLGIFLRETGELVGAVGAGEHDDLRKPEIFYSLLAEARGNGYATEAALAVTECVLATYEIDYLIGTVGMDNLASQKVLERCGYRFLEERDLLVHISDERHRFRVYRRCRCAPA